MENQEGRTEAMEVIIVDDLGKNISAKALSRCGTPDVSNISVVPSKSVNTPGKNGEAIVATDACELDKNGTNPIHVTQNGKIVVKRTETTAEMRAAEEAEKKRIAEMPSPDEVTSKANSGEDR